jgi:thioredoxin reductase (NADPH)
MSNITGEEKRNLVIIGSGPAGLTSGIYAARADLHPLLYEGLISGGQLINATLIENYPGFPDGIQGMELMEKIKKQAIKFGADLRFSSIEKVDFLQYPFLLWDDNDIAISALSVIIATGSSPRLLGLPSEKEYLGYGVSTCATCDGYFYKGKVVAVVGGGDTAAIEAIYLANLASKVYIIHRRDQLRACTCNQKRFLIHQILRLSGIVWWRK